MEPRRDTRLRGLGSKYRFENIEKDEKITVIFILSTILIGLTKTQLSFQKDGLQLKTGPQLVEKDRISKRLISL